MSAQTFHLASVRHVKRFIVGNTNPANPAGEEEIAASLERLNRALTGSPRGTLLGVEKNFGIFNLGEHQVVLQWMVYHVGFAREPLS
ncbi:MAG: hypothetical protein MSH25_07750 [Desulfovibrio sp.]|uniref:hypothetical protein n=1 Tax=Desulfovibrio sp. TaxID=885 RepID=UPI0025C3B9A1|nr:hypothetical protein [Desulfovibrio sp.]MCI7569238.1 hypothetical protein [Desulfovibrio sp.]